jgi:V/A-type H+-transporting ATPase subunit K
MKASRRIARLASAPRRFLPVGRRTPGGLSAHAIGLIAVAVVPALVATALWVATPAALAAAPGPAIGISTEAWSWGLLGAAIATGLSSLGAGFAVAKVGTAAVGALAEKPDLFGRLLIFVGLAEGIAIYGLIVSILILNKLT